MPLRQLYSTASRLLLCASITAALSLVPTHMAMADPSLEEICDEPIVSTIGEEPTGEIPVEEEGSAPVTADSDDVLPDGEQPVAAELEQSLPQVSEAVEEAGPEPEPQDQSAQDIAIEGDDSAVELAASEEQPSDTAPDAGIAPNACEAEAMQSQSESAAGEQPTHFNMYRLYNPNSGEHFYTSSLDEARHVAEAGWRWEGVGWVAPGTGDAVYRLYNPYAGDHHYTVSAEERDTLAKLGWLYEGVGWYSGGDVQVLRQYNPNAVAGAHNFTSSIAEDAALAKAGWKSEGNAWLASNHESLPIGGFWLICSSWGTRQRYWIGSDATVAKGRVIAAEEGPGYAAYATLSDGAILRGAMDLGNGTVLLADNDGRLATKSGFTRSSSYGAGEQLYYLESTGKGYSVARSGLLSVDGGHYWGRALTGAILCGKMPKSDVLFVSNPKTGKLAWTIGWCVTDEYDGTVQRYYFTMSDLNGYIGARLGTFTEGGKRYYGRTDEGYVARGAYVISQYLGVSADGTGERYHDDTVVIADNDGVLLTREQVGELLVKAARSQIGASYDEEGSAYHAAANPQDSSFNCSGFTWWVYSTLGLNISHNQGYYSYYTGEHNLKNCQMWGVESRAAWKTNVADLVPGDIVFFSPTYDKYHTGHVGIYIGDGKMIDANTTGVMVRSIMSGSSPKATFVGGGFPITLVV